MTPSNAVFRQVFAEANKVGDAYDYVPDAETKYPYIQISESYDAPGNNSELTGVVTQIINVWGKRTQRNQLDEMVVALYNEFVTLRQSLAYNTRLDNFNYENMPDNSTGSKLFRYRIEAEFFYTKKEEIN